MAVNEDGKRQKNDSYQLRKSQFKRFFPVVDLQFPDVIPRRFPYRSVFRLQLHVFSAIRSWSA